MPETIPPFIDDATLSEIRAHTDWRGLFTALGIARDERRSRVDDWWGRSPLSEDRTASFHMSDKGWYCFSTGQGGGVIELVQAVHHLNCYEAGRWLLENGLSWVGDPPADQAPGPIAAPGGRRRRTG